jgi:hypothetical protein
VALQIVASLIIIIYDRNSFIIQVTGLKSCIGFSPDAVEDAVDRFRDLRRRQQEAELLPTLLSNFFVARVS